MTPSPPQTYTGSQITPAIVVKDGAATLTEGTDYTISYGENMNAGTGSIAIVGAGNYAGSESSITFPIRRPSEMVLGITGGATTFGSVSLGEIKSGYAGVMGAEATFFFNRYFGLGAKLNVEMDEVDFGETRYNERVIFFGPAACLRLTNHKRIAFIASAGAGAMNWQWNLNTNSSSGYENTTISVGGFLSAGVNFMATQHIGFGVNLQTVLGKVTSDEHVRKPAGLGATVGVNFRF